MNSLDMKKLEILDTLTEASWIQDTSAMEMVYFWKSLMLDPTGNSNDFVAFVKVIVKFILFYLKQKYYLCFLKYNEKNKNPSVLLSDFLGKISKKKILSFL